MAQLRDKVTGELLATGVPEEVVLVAQTIGFDEVVFDGVGISFDPQAVLDLRQQRIDGLAALQAALPQDADPIHTIQPVKGTLRILRDQDVTAKELVSGAQDLLDNARARIEES